MKLGVIGLPNVGKSTLFNAITSAAAQAANYPFCTIDPNVGIVAVPDPRLGELAKLYNPEKVTPATVEFVDIAGLVRGASRGEGLGNRFLSHIREVDALVHVVRCFDDDDIAHVEGSIDPVRDVETITLELIFADLETVEKRRDRSAKLIKTGDKKYKHEVEVLDTVTAHLEEGKPVSTLELEPSDEEIVSSLFLLTQKPTLYAANIAESDIGVTEDNLPYVRALRGAVTRENAGVLTVSAKVEEEIARLDEAERGEYLEAVGLSQSGLARLIKRSYDILGLISYLTAGPKEVRAWTIERGTKAPQAAGKIHTDFERGFIRAEVVHYDLLMQEGSMQRAKEKGMVRSEGKDYTILDGDVVLFRFNV